MGLGAGHVMDMINRMKQNRAQRPSNRNKFRDNRESIYSCASANKKLKFKTVSQEELNLIKDKIKHDAKLERRREFLIYIMVSLFVIFAIIGIVRWLD